MKEAKKKIQKDFGVTAGLLVLLPYTPFDRHIKRVV